MAVGSADRVWHHTPSVAGAAASAHRAGPGPMSTWAFRLLWCFVVVMPCEEIITLPLVGSIAHGIGLIASAVGILYILARGRVRPLTRFHVLALLFALWAGVTSLWSIDPEATRTRIVTYVQLAVLAWLIWEIAWSPARQRALLQAYVLGGCVAAMVTIYNYRSGVNYVPSHMMWMAPVETDAARFAALNQDPNELGLILALGLPMAWYLSLSQPRRRLAWMWRLYLPLAISAILLTGSRGSAVTMLVALLIVPATQARLRLRTKAALYALAVGSLVLAGSFAPPASLERLGSTWGDVAAGYFGGRGQIWRAGLAVAGEHPLLGVGAGAFESAVDATLLWERGAHNVYLAVLVEDGIVGLCLLLAMGAAALKPLRQLAPVQRRFSLVLLLALGVGSLTLHWDHRKEFWFVLGVLAAQVVQRPAERGLADRRVAASPRCA